MDVIVYLHLNNVYVVDQQPKVWKYSIPDNSWEKIEDSLKSRPQGLVVLAGDLTSFGVNDVQVLRNGTWQLPDSQPKDLWLNIGDVVVLP